MLRRNYKGEIITGNKELLKEEYGTGEIDSHGDPVIDWSKISKYADSDGFDTRKYIEEKRYKIKAILPTGTIILRYGSEMGRFTAPDGTPYEDLALPYKKETVEFNRYKVIGDNVNVTCIVDKGYVAPGFGSLGGAIQFLHEKTIFELLKRKVVEKL